MVDFIAQYFDAVIGFLFGVLAYAYKKGKQDTTSTSIIAALKKQLTDLHTDHTELKKEYIDLKKIVSTIEEALDRSFATTKYVHDTFPSKEVFDIKMESVQEHIAGKIDNVMSLLKMQRAK